jgi:tRNA modification GTPase
MHFEDTIVARASAVGQSAVSVIRISGPRAIAIADSITDGKVSSIPSHNIKLRKIQFEGEFFDEALIAVFLGSKSFTGEDSVEISLHGSEFITRRVLELLVSNGARQAGPGEFTMRAYMNGKLDLAQAEAVADLIAAQTANEQKLALSQLKGGVSSKIQALRSKILEFAALIELELDFGEEDVEFADRASLQNMIKELRVEVDVLLRTFQSGNAIMNGIPVAIVGKPNAGKSTLLNALVGEERAIVTDIPGTTRDTIEETAILNDIRFRFIDTAGIRETENVIELMGIERTFKSLAKAALVWLVVSLPELNEHDIDVEIAEIQKHTDAEIWIIGNKSDLWKGTTSLNPKIIAISAKQNHLEELMHHVKDYTSSLISGTGDTTITNTRHFEVLKNAAEKLLELQNAANNHLTGDMLSHHMRSAMEELGKITGAIDSEEVLGQIFSKFCIGK